MNPSMAMVLMILASDEEEQPKRPTTSEFETTGRHKEWQRRHGKGKFSKKYDRNRRRKK